MIETKKRREKKDMTDFREYITEPTKKKNKDSELWVRIGPYSSQRVQKIIKYTGTSAPKELAQIFGGVFEDLATKKKKLVSCEKQGSDDVQAPEVQETNVPKM